MASVLKNETLQCDIWCLFITSSNVIVGKQGNAQKFQANLSFFKHEGLISNKFSFIKAAY